MTRIRLSLALLVTSAALVVAGCGGSSDSSSGSNGVPDDAVATVSGSAISRAEVDDLMGLAARQQKQQLPKAGTAEYQSLQQQIVAFLVVGKEYEQELARRGQTVTQSDVDKARAKLLKTRFSGSEKKLQAFMKTNGYTDEEFDVALRRNLVEQRLHDDVTKGVTVTDAAVKAYYEKNKGQSAYTTPAQRRVRHILVAVNSKGIGTAQKGVTDAKVDFAKSKKLADKLYKDLTTGKATFAAVVKKYSQDPGSNTKGGEYTDVKGTFAKEFEEAAFTLGTRVISKPVRTPFGSHLIQPLGPTKEATTMSYAKAKSSIRTLLLQQKEQPVIDRFGTQFTKRYASKVKYAAGFAPPQTSTSTTGTTTTS